MLLFASLSANTPPSAQTQVPLRKGELEVQQLDMGIAKLENLRNLELSKAARAQDQGDRLQFIQGNLVEARQHWQRAENSREIAKRYQEEIDKLTVKRNQLITEYKLQDKYPIRALST